MSPATAHGNSATTACRLGPLLLSLLPTVSCIPTVPASYQADREVSALTDAAEAYWSAMRWAEYTDAATVIESIDDRMKFIEDLRSGTAFKVSDAKVLDVEVTDILSPEDLPHLREGKVMVQVEGYRVPEMVLESEITVQEWYRTESGWYLDWSPR